MKQTKEFNMKGKDLIVTITGKDVIYIPKGEERVEIGSFDQVTTQVIPKENVQDLVDFITGEKNKADDQLKKVKKEYDLVKDVADIDEKVQSAIIKAIDKGSKKFKTEMQILAKHIQDLQRKKQFAGQIEYIEKEMVTINEDLDKLLKAIK